MSEISIPAGTREPPTILLVEPDPVVRLRTAAHLRKCGFRVLEAARGQEALNLVRSGRITHLMLIDIDNGRAADSLDVLGVVQRDFLHISTLTISANADGIPRLVLTGSIGETMVVNANMEAEGQVPELSLAVLVVEDEVLIRAAAAQYLRGAGFDVLEAMNVDEALQVLAAAPHVRVLFSDVVLPGGRNGFDLLQAVQRDFPHVKVLFTSGIVRADELAHRGITFIRKPYFLFEVERHIRSILGTP